MEALLEAIDTAKRAAAQAEAQSAKFQIFFIVYL